MPRRLTTDFQVDPTSQIPAPGMPALKTDNLTVASKDVRKGSIDSMADAGGEIPDPELHQWTIADALAEGRPALVLFGTPAYCESLFCGPEVIELNGSPPSIRIGPCTSTSRSGRTTMPNPRS